MTNETAAGVRLDDPAAFIVLVNGLEEGLYFATGPMPCVENKNVKKRTLV